MPLMLSLASLGRSGGLPSAHPMRSRVRARMRGGTARSTWPARGAMRPTTAYAIAPGAGPFACRYRAPRLDGPAHCEPTSRHCLACLRPEITIVRDAASCRFLHALSSSSARRAGCADISKNFDSVAHPRSVQSNSNERGRPRRALSRFVAMARRAGRLRVAHARPCAFERIRRRMRGRRVKGRRACPGCGRRSGRGGATIGAPWIAERGMRRFCMRRAGGGFKPRRVPPCAARRARRLGGSARCARHGRSHALSRVPA